MSVDIRPCDIYDLKYIFLEKAKQFFQKITLNQFPTIWTNTSFLVSKIFFQITLINVGITAE